MFGRAFARAARTPLARRAMSSGPVDKWWEKSTWDLFLTEAARDGYRPFFYGKITVLLMAFAIHNSVGEEDKKESVYYSKIAGTYGSHH
mmetsp:Transcript_42500/g.133238  ORF Transcript_42500/g.133238 Transcript_42500/m.133238 type:complete len:89 (-) Transcript_42500:1301-1567(-)